MFTRMAPTLAVAYWRVTHSALLGDQIPTRSPGSIPRASSPRATASTAAWNWAEVMRTPWRTLTRPALSGALAAVRSRFWPMVSPSNATGLAPCTYEGSLATSMAASLPQSMRATAPFCDDIPMNPTVRTPPPSWAPESWRAFPAAQQPHWPDSDALDRVLVELASQPPL